MDDIDRGILNALQGGFPICERPFAVAAQSLELDEDTLIARLRQLQADGLLSRFGPLYNAERMGGSVTLAAMKVAPERLEFVAGAVNAFPEVAHNYEREHLFNIWFVVATEDPARVAEVLREIEECTGETVYDMPKLEEFYIGLRLEA